MTRSWRFSLLVALVVALAPAAFATNGYFTHGEGTVNKALAGAGVALPQEALDAAANPAAAAFIAHGYSVGVGLFSPDREYTVKGSPSGYPQTFGLQPGTVRSESRMFPMPALAANFRPSDKTAIAVSLVARGGMNTNYHTNTFYGSGTTGVDLGQGMLTATFARKLGANHAFGISAILALQRFKANGLEAFSQFSSDPQKLTGNGYDVSQGLGVQAGYLGRITRDLSVGASFMPKIAMSEFDEYRGLFADGGGFDIPASAEVGFSYRLPRGVTVSAEFQRIHYSDVRSVGNHLMPALMSAPLGTETAAGFGWNDVDVIKGGLQWAATPVWTWRAGMSHCNQPIQASEVLFNILAPGTVEQHYTAGFSKMLKRAPGRFNFAMMYAPARSVSGPNPLEAPGAQSIDLQLSEWEAEFSYSIGF